MTDEEDVANAAIVEQQEKEQNEAAREQAELQNQQMQEDAVANDQQRRQEIEQRQAEARELRRKKRDEQRTAALDSSEIKDEHRDVDAIRDVTIGKKKDQMTKSVEPADDALEPAYNPGSYSVLGKSYFGKSEESKAQRVTVQKKAQEFQQTPVFQSLAGMSAYKTSLQEKQRESTGSYEGWDIGGAFATMGKAKVKKGESELYGMSSGIRYAIPGAKGAKGAKDTHPQAINLLGGFGVKKSGNKEIRQSQGKGFPVANNFGFDNVTSPFARYADSYVAPAKDLPYNPGSYSVLGSKYFTDPAVKKKVQAEAVAFAATPVFKSLRVAHGQKLKQDIRNIEEVGKGKPPHINPWLTGMTEATARKDPRDEGFYGVSGGIRYAIPQKDGKTAAYRDPNAINLLGGFGVNPNNRGEAKQGEGFPKVWGKEVFNLPFVKQERDGKFKSAGRVDVPVPPDTYIPTKIVKDKSGNVMGVIPKAPQRPPTPDAIHKDKIHNINASNLPDKQKKQLIREADAELVANKAKYIEKKKTERAEKKYAVVIGGVPFTSDVQKIMLQEGKTRKQKEAEVDEFIDRKQREFKTGKYAEKPGKRQPTSEEIQKAKEEKEAKTYAENIAKGWKPIKKAGTEQVTGWFQKKQMISLKSKYKAEEEKKEAELNAKLGKAFKAEKEHKMEREEKAQKGMKEFDTVLERMSRDTALGVLAGAKFREKQRKEHEKEERELNIESAKSRAWDKAFDIKAEGAMEKFYTHRAATRETEMKKRTTKIQQMKDITKGRERAEEVAKNKYYTETSPYHQIMDSLSKTPATETKDYESKKVSAIKVGFDLPAKKPWSQELEKKKLQTEPTGTLRSLYEHTITKPAGRLKEDLLLGIKQRGDTAKGQRSFLYGAGLQPTQPQTGEPQGHFPLKSGKPVRAPGNPIARTELKFFASPLSRGRPVRGKTKRARRKIVVANRKRVQKMKTAGKGSFLEKMFW